MGEYWLRHSPDPFIGCGEYGTPQVPPVIKEFRGIYLVSNRPNEWRIVSLAGVKSLLVEWGMQKKLA